MDPIAGSYAAYCLHCHSQLLSQACNRVTQGQSATRDRMERDRVRNIIFVFQLAYAIGLLREADGSNRNSQRIFLVSMAVEHSRDGTCSGPGSFSDDRHGRSRLANS